MPIRIGTPYDALRRLSFSAEIWRPLSCGTFLILKRNGFKAVIFQNYAERIEEDAVELGPNLPDLAHNRGLIQP